MDSPQSQFDRYYIRYYSVVFNLQSDLYLLIDFDFHYICFNGLRHRHIRYLYRLISISIIYVAVVCQRYLAILDIQLSYGPSSAIPSFLLSSLGNLSKALFILLEKI